MAKLNFQQSLLRSSVSHDPSEIILYPDLALNKLVLNNINVKNTFVLYFFKIPQKWKVNCFIYLKHQFL